MLFSLLRLKKYFKTFLEDILQSFSKTPFFQVEFDGSKCKEELLRLLQNEGQSVDVNDKKITDFEKIWTSYRNTEETPEATRNYAQQMKRLLGIKTN